MSITTNVPNKSEFNTLQDTLPKETLKAAMGEFIYINGNLVTLSKSKYKHGNPIEVVEKFYEAKYRELINSLQGGLDKNMIKCVHHINKILATTGDVKVKTPPSTQVLHKVYVHNNRSVFYPNRIVSIIYCPTKFTNRFGFFKVIASQKEYNLGDTIKELLKQKTVKDDAHIQLCIEPNYVFAHPLDVIFNYETRKVYTDRLTFHTYSDKRLCLGNASFDSVSHFTPTTLSAFINTINGFSLAQNSFVMNEVNGVTYSMPNILGHAKTKFISAHKVNTENAAGATWTL